MKPRLLAAALAVVTVLGAGACSGGQPTAAGPTTTGTRASSASTASATPSGPAEPTTTAPETMASQTNPGSGGGGGNAGGGGGNAGGGGGAAPPPPPSPQEPNAAFCQTFNKIIELSFGLVGPALALEYSTDPAEIERAWQEIHRIAQEGAALARQAVGQTTDAYLKSVAQALATQFDHMAAAAAARDKAALDSIPRPDLPEPEGICGW